jgi:hypothetical protein
MVHFQFTNGGGKLIFKEYHFLLRWLFCKINMFFCQARIPLSRMHLVLFAILKIIIVIFWEKFIGMSCAGGNGFSSSPCAPSEGGHYLRCVTHYVLDTGLRQYDDIVHRWRGWPASAGRGGKACRNWIGRQFCDLSNRWNILGKRKC